MNFKDVLARTKLTGFSVPVFGIQWNPSESEIEKARRIIAYLEDRRVLYAPYDLEIPEHCIESVLEIRKFLTKEIGNVDSNTELATNLRSMRVACRKFLDSISDERNRKIITYSRYSSWKFYDALGIMRYILGIHTALIAVSYGLDVEDELASILPNLDEYEENGFTKLNLDSKS